MKFADDVMPRRRDEVHRQDLPDGSTLLFDPNSKIAYPISESAVLVWEDCDGHHTVAAMVDRVFETYDAPRETVTEDVARLLEHLAEIHLIEEAPADS